MLVVIMTALVFGLSFVSVVLLCDLGTEGQVDWVRPKYIPLCGRTKKPVL